MKQKLGTNQHRTKYQWFDQKTKIRISVCLLFIAALIYVGHTSKVDAEWQYNVVSPCPDRCAEESGQFTVPVPTPTPTPDVRWENVTKLIIDEFSSEGPQVTYEALSVSKAESGWKHNAYNWNTNNTADQCPFQINDVHIKRFGTKYKTDVKECIRVAHVIYKEQGWEPWVAAHKLGLVR